MAKTRTAKLRIMLDAEPLLLATAKASREMGITKPQVLLGVLINWYNKRPEKVPAAGAYSDSADLLPGFAGEGSPAMAPPPAYTPPPLTERDRRIQEGLQAAREREDEEQRRKAAARGPVGSFDPGED